MTSSVIYYSTDARKNEIYLLNTKYRALIFARVKSRVKLKCKCGLIESIDADPVKTFHENVLAKFDVIPATGDAIRAIYTSENKPRLK